MGSKIVLACMLVFGSVYGTAGTALPQPKYGIVADNRVLATVRGQVITIVDVMKKLDMIFYQQFPQYRGQSEAKYEFYQANWRRILDDLVDRYVALAWAEDKQFQVTNGDIREEMEEMFGPDVMMNLYDAGLSLHEVHEMVKADILLRRMLAFYVRMPVLSALTPEVLKKAYAERAKAAEQQKGWIWRTVTFRSADGPCPQEVAEKGWNFLEKDHLSVDEVRERLKGVEVVVSAPFHSEKNDVAPHLQTILASLPLGAYSAPIQFSGRNDTHSGWRCYIVDEMCAAEVSAFADVEQAIKEELAQPEIEVRTKKFFENLRKDYEVKVALSQDQILALEPFHLKPKTA